MADNETIADIIAEMRALSNPISDGIIAINGRIIADRLEAAHKRERGNVAKLREACANIAEYARSAMCHTTDAHVLDYLNQIEGWAKAALAAPPRNCDKGTADEQAKRMDAYCTSYRERIGGSWRCDNCPLCSIHRCALAWAQMPYEEGGAK